ncbi:hypothetical protein [Halopelagius fulvigenes]|uniref:Uncharacterized protein n=1 Tax=Halopelagius fulvigenes TaxID=1198324 RepID=A0ABD5U3F6_9EURY
MSAEEWREELKQLVDRHTNVDPNEIRKGATYLENVAEVREKQGGGDLWP